MYISFTFNSLWGFSASQYNNLQISDLLQLQLFKLLFRSEQGREQLLVGPVYSVPQLTGHENQTGENSYWLDQFTVYLNSLDTRNKQVRTATGWTSLQCTSTP